MALIDNINEGFIALTNLVKSNKIAISDNTALLPFKIGASWYKTGLYYDYMFPWSSGGFSNVNIPNRQMIGVPIKILEDTTIKSLVVNCVTTQAWSTCKLGIYDSASDNTANNLLFGSQPLDLSTTGLKSATCNIVVQKGQVIWVVYLSLATGAASTVNGISGNNNVRAFSGTSSPQYPSSPLFYKNSVTDLPITSPGMLAGSGITPRVMFGV